MALSATIIPIGATVVVAIVSAIGAGLARTLPRLRSDGVRLLGPRYPSAPRRGPERRILVWIAASVGFGVVFGAVEIGAVTLVVRNWLPPTAGWLVFAVLAITSVVGGVLDAVTASRQNADYRIRTAALATTMLVGALVTATTTHFALVLVGLALVGLPAGPLLSARSLGIENASSVSHVTRIFASVFSAQQVGFAASGLLLTALGFQLAVMVGTVALLATVTCALLVDLPRRERPNA